jgi:hypothetical protein
MSNDNSGAIFVNDRKEKDSHPDRTGTCTIGGKDYWISGWMKQKDGKPYMSIAFKPKEARAEPQRGSKPAHFDDDKGSIPF